MNDGSSGMLSLFGDEQAHDGSSWRMCPACTGQTTVLRSGRLLTRLPRSGQLRGGHIFELAMSERPTSESDGSVSSPEKGTQRLPTPTSSDFKRARSGSAWKGRVGDSLPDVVLFGTPRAADGMAHPLRDKEKFGNPRGRLEDQVATLVPVVTLPTPTTKPMSGSAGYARTGTHHTGVTLADAFVRGLGLIPAPSPSGKTSPVPPAPNPSSLTKSSPTDE